MPTLGVHTLALTPLWSPGDADLLIPPLLEHGVSAIETPLLDPANYDSRGTRAIAERHGIEIVCSLGLPEQLDPLEHMDEVIDFLTQALRVAGDSGSSVLTGVTYGAIGKTSGAPRTQREESALCTLVERAAKIAKDLNMRLGLEPCNRYETHLLNTAQQTADIINRVGADNVFIHLDTYHMNIEEQGMVKGFKDAGQHLGYVHLSESNRGVPGQGNIDWQRVFHALNDVGYEGILTLESFVHLAPEIAAGLAVWRPVADEPDQVIRQGLPFLMEQARAAGICFP